MRRMWGWLTWGAGLLALAGCVTAQPAATPPRAEADVPAVLKSCGRVNLSSANEIFELCGIAPDGAATAKAQYQLFTQGCGVIEVSEELKHFICREADSAFAANFPVRTAAFIAENYSGKTRADYDKRSGNQLIYFASTGRLYLWVPNQTKVIEGEWIVFRSAQLCIHLAGFTEHSNTGWDCYPMRQPQSPTEIAEGDVAGLARHGGKVPWVLAAQPRMALAQVVERVKSLPNGMEPEHKTPKDKDKPDAKPSEPLAPMVRNEEPGLTVMNEPPAPLAAKVRPPGPFATATPLWAADLFAAPSGPVRPCATDRC